MRTAIADDDDKPEPKKRRSRGDGALYWSEERQRWIAEATVGYRPNGKRIIKKASDKTKTGAKAKLKEILRDYDDGLTTASGNYTVKDAVKDWLTYGLPGRHERTVEKYRILAEVHVIPHLGKVKLRDLTAEQVDRWLTARAAYLATSSVQDLHSLLRRAVSRAQARDKVKRNVVMLCEPPTGKRPGRPSKALTFAQAEAILNTAERTSMHAYIVTSLLTGARTEELRALTWGHVDLVGKPDAKPPVPPSIMVWHSVRDDGDTKTQKSRRTLALPVRCVEALKAHGLLQNLSREGTDRGWEDDDLVFATADGSELDAANVRRDFRRVVKAAGLDAKQWTPRELRHSFVSLLSDSGMPIEQISRLVGHNGSAVTERVYRHQLRPVLQEGAQAMDGLFPGTFLET